MVLAKQPDGTPCALKVLKTTNPRWQMLHKNIIQEIEALQKLDHPNIMKLIGSGIGAEWIENGETVQGDYLATELVTQGELFDVLASPRGPFTEGVAKRLFK